MKILNIIQTTNMKTFLKLENQITKNLPSQIILIVCKTAQGAFQIFKTRTVKWNWNFLKKYLILKKKNKFLLWQIIFNRISHWKNKLTFFKVQTTKQERMKVFNQKMSHGTFWTKNQYTQKYHSSLRQSSSSWVKITVQ